MHPVFLVLVLGLWLTPVLAVIELSDKEQELQQVRERIQQLQSALASGQERQQELTNELRDMEQEIGASTARLRGLEGELEGQQELLNGLAKRKHQQQEKLDEQRIALANQVRAAYAMGRQERLKILLNQQDPAMVSRMLVYYDYLNQARAQRVEQIGRVLEDLERTERRIAQEQRRLLGLQQREREERKLLQQNRLLRQRLPSSSQRLWDRLTVGLQPP